MAHNKTIASKQIRRNSKIVMRQLSERQQRHNDFDEAKIVPVVKMVDSKDEMIKSLEVQVAEMKGTLAKRDDEISELKREIHKLKVSRAHAPYDLDNNITDFTCRASFRSRRICKQNGTVAIMDSPGCYHTTRCFRRTIATKCHSTHEVIHRQTAARASLNCITAKAVAIPQRFTRN